MLKIVEYNAEMFDKTCRLLVDCLNPLYDEEYDYLPLRTKYGVFLEKLTLDKNSKIILAKEDEKVSLITLHLLAQLPFSKREGDSSG